MPRIGSGYAWIAAAVGLLVWGGLASSLGEGFAIPTALFGVVGGTIVLRGPLGKALARRLEGAPPLGDGPPAEELLAELDELRARVLELEERVDFSERLLARHREPVAGTEEGRL